MESFDDEDGPRDGGQVVPQARWTARGLLFAATVLSPIALMVVFVWIFVDAVRIPTAQPLAVASDGQVADLQNQINDLHHEMDRLLGIVGAGFGMTATLAVLVVAFNLVSPQWANERDRLRKSAYDSQSNVQRNRSVRGCRSPHLVVTVQQIVHEQVMLRHRRVGAPHRRLAARRRWSGCRQTSRECALARGGRYQLLPGNPRPPPLAPSPAAAGTPSS